jgi:hypothetical protein
MISILWVVGQNNPNSKGLKDYFLPWVIISLSKTSKLHQCGSTIFRKYY